MACVLPLLGASCVSGRYEVTRVLQAPEIQTVESLRPGLHTLGDCLEALGAPVLVQEDRDQIVLAWAWGMSEGWSVRASLNLFRGPNPSLSFSDGAQQLDALLAVFDASESLVMLRRGKLGDLTQRGLPRVPELPEVADPGPRAD